MESEPRSPQGQRERAEFVDEDRAIDDLTHKAASLLRAMLPPDLDFVLITLKERVFYQHQCTAASADPLTICSTLGNALMDMQKRLPAELTDDPPQEHSGLCESEPLERDGT